MQKGGDVEHLTVSSDAAINSPRTLYEQIRACVQEAGITLDLALTIATSNTARILRMPRKACLREGADADLLLLRKDGLDISSVIAGGRLLMAEGEMKMEPAFMESSNRRISLHGAKQS